MPITLQTTNFNVIYVYSRDAHPGLLKIGKTSVDAYDVSELEPNCEKLNQAAYDRLKEAVTLGVTDLKLLHTEVAHFIGSDGMAHRFDDHAVHTILINSGFEKADLSSDLGDASEWFKVTLPDAVKAIAAVKAELTKIDGPKIKLPEHPVIIFREEQELAISMTVSHFNEEGKKMLWNAKMRFGKTLCALEVINRLDVKKVMILTHRPTVRSGWFDDYHLIKFKEEFQYGSKNGKPGNHLYDKKKYPKEYVEGKDLKTMQDDLAKEGKRYIYFASMQDLRGKEKNKKGEFVWKDNNKLVYDTEWDLIIFDEAHEGTQTALGQQVATELFKKNDPLKLYLSGTPYNIMSQFEEEEIFTWDYVMEQTAKAEWDQKHPGEPNPYEGLAKLNIYTYSLGDVFENNPEYFKSEDDFFNFAEFFRVWTGDEKRDGKPLPDGVDVDSFVHEDDVKAFLDLLCREEPISYYPYSNADFRNALSHTLWMLPGVAEANRLAYLINHHKLHTQFGFEVVSVAGEGYAIENAGDNVKKIEKQEKDALERVKQAIKNHDKTITLSCGRLTTGVSVPEWTGVFMLSGGYVTGAALYMQTIFRGQTPYKNGAIKTNCYAFDFAPDRTLTVINDFIKQQPTSRNKPQKHGDEGERTASSLHFLPVVAMVGGKEVEYNANMLIERVNKAYTDHVVSHGFKSKRLFKNFANFKPEDHALLDQIGKLIGGGKGIKVEDGMIVMTDGGLTGENGGKGKNTGKGNKGGKGNKKPKTSKKPKDDEGEQRRRSQSVLDYIFVRLPLLLFGAVSNPTGLTIDDLLSDDIIDQESWNEFMPPKFTKEMFRQLSHLIAVDVLISSTAEIIKMAKKTDELPIQQRIVEVARIISRFHFPDKETVLTPWRVVNMHMSSTLGGYDFYDENHNHLIDELRLVEQGDITTNVFCDPSTRILELNSKSGVYPLWLACTLWKLQRNTNMDNEDDWNLWKSVLENNLFVVCKTRMAEKITRRVLVGYRTDIHVNTVSFEDIIDRIKDEKRQKSLIKAICSSATYGNTKNNDMLKFNAVVSNPPYQIGINKEPVYHYFIDLGMKLSSLGTIIHPGRFLFNAGKTPKAWNNKILNDEHIKVVNYWENSDMVFKSVDIKGGVAITMWDQNNTIGPIGMFVLHDELHTIHEKVAGFQEKSMSELVYSRDLYQLNNTFYKDFPKFEGRQSKGHRLDLGTTVFTLFPEVFFDKKPSKNGYGLVIGRENDQRVAKWILSKYLKLPDNFEKFKVLIAKSNGTGEFGETLSSPFVAEPFHAHNTTFLSIGKFDTSFEAESCLKYIKTKFARCLLGILKVTQDNPRNTWKLVPQQNFTKSNSEINWNLSIDEIDQALFAKYHLTEQEINFIESMVKPME